MCWVILLSTAVTYYRGQLLKSDHYDLISKLFVIFACGGPEHWLAQLN